MKVKIRKKLNLFSILLIISALVIINSTNTKAIDPDEVDVTIRITYLDYFYIDGDSTSAGDVYFKIYHLTGTSTSNTAWNDYEDMDTHELDNDDFDGNGYYNQQYENVDLDTGDLTWIIQVWDEDSIWDDLLYEGTLTIKNPGTTGSASYSDIHAFGHWLKHEGAWVPNHTYYNNNYLHFEWDDGPVKEYTETKSSNGLILWVSLYYT